MELRNNLQSKLGFELPATLVFDFPTISALATYLATRQRDADSTRPGPAAFPTMGGLVQQLNDLLLATLGIVATADQPLSEAGIDSLGELLISRRLSHAE